MRLIIIGGGPGGYTAAFEAAAKGMKVTVVEDAALGGTCLNHGCIPTKTLRASADALALARRMGEFGVGGCQDAAIDPAAVQKRKNAVIHALAGGLQKTCAALGVDLVKGRGRLLGPGKVAAATEAGEIILEGDAIIIATGSRILDLPGLPVDHKFILNSDDALDLENVPEKLLIVGGGVIGCELACIFHAFGSEVAIVEGQDRLLPIPSVDQDISSLLAREMRKRKIRMFTGTTFKDPELKDGKVSGMLAPSPFVPPEKAVDRESPIQADMVFVTVGRAPATGGLGLEENGVKLDKRGWVEVDDKLQTGCPGVYAVGDALGPSHVMLAHAAAMEGLTVVARLLGGDGRMDYSAVPSAIFTEPEIGCVGLSEAQAKAAGGNVVCATVQMRSLGKAQAMGELPGIFKIIANGGNGKILGAQIMGAHASDLIAEGALALHLGATLEDVANTIHAHPTLAEGFFEAARQAMAVNK